MYTEGRNHFFTFKILIYIYSYSKYNYCNFTYAYSYIHIILSYRNIFFETCIKIIK